MTNNNQQTPEFLKGNKPTMSKDEADKILKDLNPNKIIQDNKENIEDTMLQSMANERAMNEPLPGVVNHAFDNDDIEVTISTGETIAIRQMRALDIKIFKLVNAPFYKLIMNDITPVEVNTEMITTEDQMFSLIYQFTNPVADVYKLTKKSPQDYLEFTAIEIGSKYSPSDLVIIIQAVMDHIGIVTKAKVECIPAESGDGNKKKLTVQQ